MKRIILIPVLIFVFSDCLYSQEYNRTNIRGLVVSSYENSEEFSISAAYVDLYWYNGYEWVVIDRTMTDQNGFYFFYDVFPGEYFIQVNGSKNYKVVVYSIDPRYQFQDLPKLYY